MHYFQGSREHRPPPPLGASLKFRIVVIFTHERVFLQALDKKKPLMYCLEHALQLFAQKNHSDSISVEKLLVLKLEISIHQLRWHGRRALDSRSR